MTTKTETERALPVELQLRDVPIDAALCALASRLEEMARSVFPLGDIECSLIIDGNRASLHFRACR